MAQSRGVLRKHAELSLPFALKVDLVGLNWLDLIQVMEDRQPMSLLIPGST